MFWAAKAVPPTVTQIGGNSLSPFRQFRQFWPILVLEQVLLVAFQQNWLLWMPQAPIQKLVSPTGPLTARAEPLHQHYCLSRRVATPERGTRRNSRFWPTKQSHILCSATIFCVDFWTPFWGHLDRPVLFEGSRLASAFSATGLTTPVKVQ